MSNDSIKRGMIDEGCVSTQTRDVLHVGATFLGSFRKHVNCRGYAERVVLGHAVQMVIGPNAVVSNLDRGRAEKP